MVVFVNIARKIAGFLLIWGGGAELVKFLLNTLLLSNYAYFNVTVSYTLGVRDLR